jgi:hydroxymethylpyrimidine/phosphomethylpyrimidine kinase
VVHLGLGQRLSQRHEHGMRVLAGVVATGVLEIGDAVEELIQGQPPSAAAARRFAEVDRRVQLARQERLDVVRLAAGDAVPERLQNGSGREDGIIEVESRPRGNASDELVRVDSRRLHADRLLTRSQSRRGQVAEVLRQLGDHVVQLLAVECAPQRGEDGLGMLPRGLVGHAFALGDALHELIDAERLGFVPVVDPLGSGPRQLLGDVARLPAGEALGERAQRGLYRPLGLLPGRLRVPLDGLNEALVVHLARLASRSAVKPLLASAHRGALIGAEITPVEPDPVRTGEGRKMVPRVLTIAGSDSGGGAGIQADLKAFAAAGAHGMSAIVALTAQSTAGVTAVHEPPPAFVTAQLEAVFSDLGVDAAKTGMLFSSRVIEAVADFLEAHPVPLVVDPVMVASSGAQLLEDDAVEALVTRLFPLAVVVTPNLAEARALTGGSPKESRAELAEQLVSLGAPAAIVTGGHGDPVDHLFDGGLHVEISVERLDVPATHGAGCTHSATLAALLARGLSLEDAARGAARAATDAVRHGLVELGAGDGPVDVLNVKGRT